MKNVQIFVFGGTGDLARKKLIPALCDVFCSAMGEIELNITGIGRTSYNEISFRELMEEEIILHSRFTKDKEKIQKFLENLSYLEMNSAVEADYETLEKIISGLSSETEIIYYLATPPSLYENIASSLHQYHLSSRTSARITRLVVEKPFGKDYQSACDLDEKLRESFWEKDIFRIDHYLGKETVQNILVTRFSNSIFEAIWNRNHIEHVQITASESSGVGGRYSYYEEAGALRDMIQNHLLQLTALIAMEPPPALQPELIRNEIHKVMMSLRPLSPEQVKKSVIRGQYVSSTVRGEKKSGYREEKGVNPESRIETFSAMKFYIDNWRWGGVPFFVRTGKALPIKVTEVVIRFKSTPYCLFSDVCGSNINELVMRIQPDEGLLLSFGLKVPGKGFRVKKTQMDFRYSELNDETLPGSYERLIQDVIQGDSTLFSRGDTLKEAWKFLDPIFQEWKNNPSTPLFGYPYGTWGPEEATSLFKGGEDEWRYPCRNLTLEGGFCEL